jgi:hypothetical protein
MDSRRPRVARMVMFKHGVAYLERRGPADGSFELTFERDEMNDVLKSLAVWAAKGDAKITSFGFDSPESPDARLAERGLSLRPGEALDGLIESLRGRIIEVNAGGDRKRGEVIGLQYRVGEDGEQRPALLLRAGAGSVVIVDLLTVRTIHLLEEVSRERLDFVVERGQAATAGETRTVRVGLEGKTDDLRVAYVIPAPAWRVSYRIVRSGDAATLMAMGIVHNPVDEDLHDVELTLTTGQPVSFVIDLYHPKEVERPIVEETARTSAPPTEHERPEADMSGGFRRSPGGIAMAPAPLPAGGPLGGEAMTEAFEAAEGLDRGELFEYRVRSPISIPRGGSAVVPLAAPRVEAERQLVWRDGMGKNPDLVLAFTNDTGLVLEEGPAVLYDEGALAGESMLPYSPRGAPVKMTFAKDLAVRVTRRTTTATVVAGVRVEENGILEERRQEYNHSIEVDSDHAEAVKLIVEMPKVTGRTLAPDSAKPFEETASYHRFEIEVPPHGHAELVVREYQPLSRRVAVESLDAHELERWFRDRHLDAATYRALEGVLARLSEARSLEQQKKRVEAEQAAAYAKQAKISEQLAVLKETGPEGALRLRYVKELEAEQDKVNAAEVELRRLTQAIDVARRLAKDELRRIVSG